MPALFGQQPGPRQLPDSAGRHSADEGETTTTYVAVQTERAALERLLPHDFRVARPLLIVEAITVRGLPWLAGRGYEVLIVSTPVTFAAPSGASYTGRLSLVVWEDCPDAIISGREELGWSKVYADAMRRRVEASTVDYTACWGGTEFFSMAVELGDVGSAAPPWRAGPLLHYRVLPRAGEWGKLDVEQVTASFAPSAPLRETVRSGSGSFRFTPATFEQLPTQVHIVNGLAALPLGRTVDAGEIRSGGWADQFGIEILASYPVT